MERNLRVGTIPSIMVFLTIIIALYLCQIFLAIAFCLLPLSITVLESKLFMGVRHLFALPTPIALLAYGPIPLSNKCHTERTKCF